MKLAIEPLDVLFFRNAKPFNSEDSPFGETLEVPYPSTFYGALRSKILLEHYQDYQSFFDGEDEKLKKVIGTPEDTGELKIKLFSLLKSNKIEDDKLLLPLPKDLVVKKDSKANNGNIFSLKLKKKPNWFDYNSELDYILVNPKKEKVEEPEKKYLDKEDLLNYLNNSDRDSLKESNNSKELFTKEYRTGIELDKNLGRVKEGMLYRKELLRLNEEYRFYLEIEGDNDLLPLNGLIKLGGESKGASYSKLNIDTNIELTDDTKQNIKENKLFKIYLATPAIFDRSNNKNKKASLPKWIDNNLEGTVSKSKIKIKVLTAAIGKYQMISGWDIANNCPKDGYRVVPAGSVYYCQILDDEFEVDDLIDKLHGKSISDKRSEEGFGISYIGGVKNV